MVKNNKLLLVLSLACAVAVVVMIICLCIPKKADQKPFVAPPFDDNAISGEPSVSEGLGYNILYREGMSFKVGACGVVNVVDGRAEIYLTNLSENTVWLKARFYDSKGNVLGESGLIKPGEYLESVELKTIPKESEKITIKVMSYEPDTYKSLGRINLTPKILIAKQ